VSFHVPEASRLTDHPTMGSDSSHGHNGAFRVPSPEPGWHLWLICSDGRAEDAVGALGEWEHVSVSVSNSTRLRLPTWKEMAFVKDLCWDAEDVVVEFHPRKSDYVNVHPTVLHLWRWTGGDFPTPPREAV
jgi:hypothetical protein